MTETAKDRALAEMATILALKGHLVGIEEIEAMYNAAVASAGKRLVFKPIAPTHDCRGLNGFALHTESGEILPGQVRTKLITKPDKVAIIRVDFLVFDGVAVEGAKE